jgi:hypothetical protein
MRTGSLLVLAALFVVPATSLADKPKPPPIGDAADRARLLVQAIRENKPALAAPFFFGKLDFRKVKGIKNPDTYFDYLMKVYVKDIGSIRDEMKHPDSLEFIRFELGRGRNWIPRGKEGNRVPYYATYKSRLIVRDGTQEAGGKERTIKVRVMITWEGRWFVTHLLRKKMHEKLDRRLIR